MALSKAELRTLALPGVQRKIDWHKNEIAKYLEEFPELQTSAPTTTTEDVPSATRATEPKPKIAVQILAILADTDTPQRQPFVFHAMQQLPTPATDKAGSVHSELSRLVNVGLLKRSDDGYQISAKGRKYLEDRTGAQE